MRTLAPIRRLSRLVINPTFTPNLDESQVGEAVDPAVPLDTVTPDFTEISAAIAATGMHIEDRMLRRYHSALVSRGFVVLAGPSGAGKTWLTEVYAKAVGAEYLLYPVSPNWVSDEDLLGYWNPLTNTFQSTRFTRFLQEAADEWEAARVDGRSPRAFHLVLDEMNLARVEHYFARFLSAMEVRSRAADGIAEISTGDIMPEKLTGNLKFVGTVNVDETTHGFSDKVYDRSQLVEMEVPRHLVEVSLAGLPYQERLMVIWDCLADLSPFAFRVVEDIKAYVAVAVDAGAPEIEALDEQVLQKILPKVNGNDDRIGAALDRLAEACWGMPLSLRRVKRMKEQFIRYGVASYFG